MAFKDILVHLDGSRGREMRLKLAIELARRQKAHLLGLYGVEPMPIPASVAPGIGTYGDVEAMSVALGKLREATEAAAAVAEAEFGDALRKGGATGEWQVLEGAIAESVTARARYADITVLGQADPEAASSQTAPALPGSVLTDSGRPVLLVPYVGHFATLGQHVLVAWTETREAARAAGAAMPLLEQAEHVTVLSIDVPAEAEAVSPAAQFVQHLARHGIAAEASTLVSDGIEAGELLLSRAADLGADLIVMGCYGHSPTREFLFGGATRSVLRHMTVPVLMAH